MLKPKMPSLSDREDLRVPSGLPAVIDAHVHIFPFGIFTAVWKWFDENGWRIRYQIRSDQVIDFLLAHGVAHIIALQYAHKAGIARMLNSYMVDKCRAHPGSLTGLATVFPGEPEAEKILQEAFDAGLAGLKLHAHVQCFDVNCEQMYGIYECCRINKKPILMHIGREPKSAAYRCDPHQLCSAEKCEQIVRDFPDLKICIPHLGLDEVRAYKKMTETYDNLWLDTAMAVSGYFPLKETLDLSSYRADRLMYGSDFPSIPYAWDRELKRVRSDNLPEDFLERFCCKNAVEFFNLEIRP